MSARAHLVVLVCLLACGCGKEKSTDQLLEDLKSSQDRDRLLAVRTLPERKGNAAKVVPALIEALKDRQNDVRISAAISLGPFGEQARDAIPALQAALRDRDARVRNAASTALSRIDPQQFPGPSTPQPAQGN
jgi:HEAT repeat protein